MGQSSYEKIYKALYNTKQVQALLESVHEKIVNAHVFDVEFTLHRPEKTGDQARAAARFKVRLPTGTGSTENGQVWISLGIDKRAVVPIVDELFGVKGGVPTYFCRKDVVTGEKYHKSAGSFPDWLDTELRSQFKAEIEAAQARILEEVRDWQGSELVARKQREFLVSSAMEDIKKVLAGYDHLGKDVLKSALDEFLVHSVFEYMDDMD